MILLSDKCYDNLIAKLIEHMNHFWYNEAWETSSFNYSFNYTSRKVHVNH